MKFNWKSKDSNGTFVYKYPNCVFCNSDWHSMNSPSQHIFEECQTVHELLILKSVWMIVKIESTVNGTCSKLVNLLISYINMYQFNTIFNFIISPSNSYNKTN